MRMHCAFLMMLLLPAPKRRSAQSGLLLYRGSSGCWLPAGCSECRGDTNECCLELARTSPNGDRNVWVNLPNRRRARGEHGSHVRWCLHWQASTDQRCDSALPERRRRLCNHLWRNVGIHQQEVTELWFAFILIRTDHSLRSIKTLEARLCSSKVA